MQFAMRRKATKGFLKLSRALGNRMESSSINNILKSNGENFREWKYDVKLMRFQFAELCYVDFRVCNLE
jgi:hypothetical protein